MTLYEFERRRQKAEAMRFVTTMERLRPETKNIPRSQRETAALLTIKSKDMKA